jgi:hypothetical protein
MENSVNTLQSPWRIMRTTYFEAEKTALVKFIATNILPTLDEAHPGCDFYIRTHWRRGPHVDVGVRCERVLFDGEVRPALERSLAGYCAQWPSQTVLDEASFLLHSQQLSLMELQPGALSPMYANNQVFLADDEPELTGPPGIVAESQRIFMSRCWRLFGSLGALKEQDRNIFMLTLVGMLAMVGTYFRRGGLNFGHLSFRAHAEYFFSMYDRSGAARRDFEALWSRAAPAAVPLIRAIDSGRIENDGECGAATAHILEEWRSILDATFPQLVAVVAENAGALNDASFFESTIKALAAKVDEAAWFRDPQMSEMEQIMQGERGRAFRSRPDFMTYRLLVNFYYALLPTLSVSPIQKFCVCHLVANACEEIFSRDWRSYLKPLMEGAAP